MVIVDVIVSIALYKPLGISGLVIGTIAANIVMTVLQLRRLREGLNGRLEMNNWIAAGVSEKKLFHALTIDNARMLHLDAKIGTVEPGKTANPLLLRDNPLRSVEAYDTIETVFLRGRPIPAAHLGRRSKSE